VKTISRAKIGATTLAALFAAFVACRAPAESSEARCAQAKRAAADAWSGVLPAMRAAVAAAHSAASNCDGPTRDQPPCGGQMSDRFLAQSLTSARLSEVERARDATLGGDPLAMREAARDVKDDVKVQAGKKATEAASGLCASVATAAPSSRAGGSK
jgi:hypothetical protein